MSASIRKGRTARIRKTKKIITCDDFRQVDFLKWLKSYGFVYKELQSAIFSDTGRGLQAKKRFKENDTLISIPKSLLISSNVVHSSDVGKLLEKYNQTISCLQCLSIFLIIERHKKEKSKWYHYICSLPRIYSNSLYWNKDDISCLPEFIQNIIKNDKTKFKKSVKELKPIVQYLKENIYFGDDIFIEENFRWAYSCINTRCIFMKQEESPPFVDDSTDIFVLAPFLDLLNHSSEASVTAKFNFSNDCYEIVTHCSYKKYEQVFICYGPHDNTKLLTEYGFIVPSNRNNSINISLDDICRVFYVRNEKQPSKKKLSFLTENELHRGMLISNDGASWNLKRTIDILFTDNHTRHEWLKIISKDTDTNEETKRIILMILTSLMDEFTLRKKICEDKSNSFGNMAMQLIDELLGIIVYNINVLGF